MTTWALAREALRTAVVSASGLPDVAVYWADAGQPYATEPRIRLSVLVATDTGTRLVEAFNAGTKTINLAEISEIIEFTLSARCETESNDVEPTALGVSTVLRKGFKIPSVAAALTAAELVFYGQSNVNYVPYTSDERNVCAYNVDLFMRGQFELSVTGETYGTIEHTKFEGTLVEGSDTLVTEIQVDKP